MKKLIGLLFLVSILVSCNGDDETQYDRSSRYDKICIEGHVYFKRRSGYKGFLAIKLNDDGTPVKCENYNKNKNMKNRRLQN